MSAHRTRPLIAVGAALPLLLLAATSAFARTGPTDPNWSAPAPSTGHHSTSTLTVLTIGVLVAIAIAAAIALAVYVVRQRSRVVSLPRSPSETAVSTERQTVDVASR